MNFQTTNVAAKVSALFKNLDKHSLKNLVGRTAFSLEGHILGSTRILEITKQEERNNISESTIQDSLQETTEI